MPNHSKDAPQGTLPEISPGYRLSSQYNGSKCMKLTIAVSGAAETGFCAVDAVEKAEELGREIARQCLVLVTGATTGIPYWSAKGAKEEGGFVVGLSPASSEAAHVRTYRLPTDYHDIVIYTGFEYSGRNLILTRSADAIIIICGRIGTMNEFTVAFEDQKPIGVLTGTGGTADMLEGFVKGSHRGPGRVVFDTDPKRLLTKLVAMVQKRKAENGVKVG
jgi:uncharacterized protein (TIGR00725 family)